MLFNVESDEGVRITGYVVPDSFSGSTALRVTERGRELMILPCEEERSALVVAGRHETGRCGFCIDEMVFPRLSECLELELYDLETGLLIYRRRKSAEILQKRVFRLEASLMPLWRLDNALERHFQYFHKSIERFGHETSTQVFALNHSNSLYVSGALIVRAYEHLLAEDFCSVVMLRDPYMELAERLLVLKHVLNTQYAQLFGDREMIGLAPAIEFAQQVENDVAKLRKIFPSMSKSAIARLANPVTRMLAARNVDEVPRKGAVAGALRTLSCFTIVGLREYQMEFVSQLSDLLQISVEEIPIYPDLSQAISLSRALRLVPEAEILVEQDMQVYRQVKSAIEFSRNG